MGTILELLKKIPGLPLLIFIWRLQELPKRLAVAKDDLDAIRGDDPYAKASLTAFGPDDELTHIATVVCDIITQAGLKYDSSADLRRSRLEEKKR
jgi:hypothetical protein